MQRSIGVLHLWLAIQIAITLSCGLPSFSLFILSLFLVFWNYCSGMFHYTFKIEQNRNLALEIVTDPTRFASKILPGCFDRQKGQHLTLILIVIEDNRLKLAIIWIVFYFIISTFWFEFNWTDRTDAAMARTKKKNTQKKRIRKKIEWSGDFSNRKECTWIAIIFAFDHRK